MTLRFPEQLSSEWKFHNKTNPFGCGFRWSDVSILYTHQTDIGDFDMKRFAMAAVLLNATALTPVAAQELQTDCADLLALAEQAGEDLREEFRDAIDVARENDNAQCAVYVEEVAQAGGMVAEGTDTAAREATGEEEVTREFSETETVTREVEITSEAVVEGDVLVRVPQPDVAVEQGGPEVAVQDPPANVTIDQEAAQITVRQAQPTIRVDVPSPTITIEQQAPEIIITMPRPGVSIEDAEPQIDVVMAEPSVRVTQGDPELEVDVEARFLEDGEEVDASDELVTSRTERVDASGNTTEENVVTEYQLTQAEPTVRMIESERESEVSFNAAEPQVTFEAAEPNVEFNYEQEPTIQFTQVGDVSVTIREAGEGEDGTAQQQAAAPGQQPEEEQAAATEEQPEAERMAAAAEQPVSTSDTEQSTQMLSAAEGAEQPAGEGMEIAVGELQGLDVVNAQGVELGQLGRVVTNNGMVYGVVEHGGFLGFGEHEVALPLERMGLRGDQIVMNGLSEEELEALPEYDATSEEMMDPDRMVEVTRFEG